MTSSVGPDDGGFITGDEGRSRSREPSREAQAEAARPEGPAADVPLVTTASNPSSDHKSKWRTPKVDDSRRLRQKRRLSMDIAQRLIAETCAYLAVAKRLTGCGRTVRSSKGVTVRQSANGGVFTSGVATCGSVWSCPSCSFKIRTKRAFDIALAAARHLAGGGGVLFMTFTMSHRRGEELADVWDILTDGWSHMTSGQQWQQIIERFGIDGWIKSVEVTHGLNGWHPHLHVLVFTDKPLSPLDASDDYWALRIALRDRWIHRFGSKWGRDVSQEFGLDTVPVKPDSAKCVGQYVSKVGYELALADNKLGRSEGQRHPFAIASDAAETGDLDDVDLFREWIKGSKRRKCITWSRGLRDRLLGTVEKSDEDLAAEEADGQDVAVIHKTLWALIIARRDGAKSQLISAFENGGLPLAVRVLQDLGLLVEVDYSRSLPLLRPGDPPIKSKEFQR